MTLDSTLLNNFLSKANQLLDRLETSQAFQKDQAPNEDSFAYRWDKAKGLTSIHWSNPYTQDKLLCVG